MIVLGRITTPFGVDGWVKVHAFGDDPLSWKAMPKWWLAESPSGPAESWTPIRLIACRVHGDGIIARFEGVDGRSGSEGLRGRYIGAPREALPRTAQDEYYWSDLIGLPVVNIAGESLGEVVDLIESGAHAVLQLRDKAGVERLLPFTAQVVKKVRLSPSAVAGIEVDWGLDWGQD